MYRQSHRDARPPTVIEYRSYWLRHGFLVGGLFLLALGLGVFLQMHATHLTCTRSYVDEPGTCRIQRHALFGSYVREVSADEIDALEVIVRKGSKGGKYTELSLRMKPGHGPDVDLESGVWGHVDLDDAYTIRRHFTPWLERRDPSTLEAWTSRGPITNVWTTVFSIGLAVLGVLMLREQLEQLRPIRIVVDHERGLVRVRGVEIPIAEIADVNVEVGRALFWSSGRGEHIPGHRLVIERQHGPSVCATRSYRAGHPRDHDRARKDLLTALGREEIR